MFLTNVLGEAGLLDSRASFVCVVTRQLLTPVTFPTPRPARDMAPDPS